jgi:hypothetical protein
LVEFDLIAFHMLLREFTDHIYDPVSPLVFWGNPRLAKIDGVNACNSLLNCRHFSSSTYVYIGPAP